jgi:disulfide bond formation protein DsbB
MDRFFAILAIGLSLVVVFALVVLVASRFSTAAAGVRERLQESLRGRELILAFVIALAATLGSLYMSEIADREPCKYCWFQRIAMYPLALILGIAAWKKDRLVRIYAMPMAVIGGLISAYHYLLQQFPNLSSGECSAAVPCTAAYVWEFGFVSIPYMALSSFALIIVLLAVAYVNDRAAPIEAPADTEVFS